MKILSLFFRKGSVLSKILRILDGVLGFLVLIVLALCVVFFVLAFAVGLVLFLWAILGFLLSSQDSP